VQDLFPNQKEKQGKNAKTLLDLKYHKSNSAKSGTSTQNTDASITDSDCENEKATLSNINSGELLRKSYLSKLLFTKVWQPTKKAKDHNTLIIFDWDDTLLCTSFLTPHSNFSEETLLSKSNKHSEKVKKNLNRLFMKF